MGYNKESWVDRNIQYPHRYTVTDIDSNTIELTAETGTVTHAGTAITATRMNKIEQGIEDAHNGVYTKALLTTAGDIMYASAANTPSRLPKGSNYTMLSIIGGVPQYASPIMTASASNNVILTSLTERTGTVMGQQILKNIKVPFIGTYRVTFDAKATVTPNQPCKIYVNGVETVIVASLNTTYTNYAYDINVPIINSNITFAVYNNTSQGWYSSIKNLYLKGDINQSLFTVVQD